MMAWESASAEQSLLLETALARFDCEKKMMFGGPAYFVNGNMFSGVHGRNILLRLDEADREAIEAAHDEVGPFEPMGRPMKEYVALPEGLDLPAPELADWVGRSFTFAASLPPKEKKPPKQRAGSG
jgi:TfoX/Sxy family transcriptional regulator of competence genes